MRHKIRPGDKLCDTFWGTHGCHKRQGHKGKHRCQSGCPSPIGYDGIFGDDVTPENVQTIRMTGAS